MNNKLLQIKRNLNLKGIDNSVIMVHEKIYYQIRLEKLNSPLFNIALLMVNDNYYRV